MGEFLTFKSGSVERSRAMRIEEDGRGEIVWMGEHGVPMASREFRLDPEYACFLIARAQLLVDEVPEAARGDVTVGYGNGVWEPTLRQLQSGSASAGRETVAELREVADRHDPRGEVGMVARQSEAGERAAGPDASAIALWAALFFGVHAGAIVVAALVGAILIAVSPLAGAIVLFGGLFVGSVGAYFGVGHAYGARYSTGHGVALPAVLSIFVPALLIAAFGGGFAMGGTVLLPAAAWAGARFACK